MTAEKLEARAESIAFPMHESNMANEALEEQRAAEANRKGPVARVMHGIRRVFWNGKGGDEAARGKYVPLTTLPSATSEAFGDV